MVGEAGVKVCELRTSRNLNRARSHRGEGAVWEDHRGAEGPQVSDRRLGVERVECQGPERIWVS